MTEQPNSRPRSSRSVRNFRNIHNKGGAMIIGIFFLLLGLSIILRVVFNIDIPLAKILFALLLIYLGVKLLFGGTMRSEWGWRNNSTAVFSEKEFKVDADDEFHTKKYNVVFGQGTVDLTDLSSAKENSHVEVNCVFGETTVLVKEGTAVRIHANTIFGEAKMPNNNMVAFGTLNFQSPEFSADRPYVNLIGNVVFGALRFEIQK